MTRNDRSGVSANRWVLAENVVMILTARSCGGDPRERRGSEGRAGGKGCGVGGSASGLGASRRA
jgi:hypothetical protein